MGDVTCDFSEDFDNFILPNLNWQPKMTDYTTVSAYDPFDTNIYQYVFPMSGNYTIPSLKGGLAKSWHEFFGVQIHASDPSLE